MDKKNTWKSILTFSLPVTLIGIFDLLLIWIDLFWIYFMVGEADALAAVRVSASVVILIEAVLVAVVSSLLIYLSQNLGAGKLDEVKRGIRGAFSFTIYGGIVITCLGVLFLPLLVKLFGVNAATSEFVKNYLGVYLLGYVFMSLNNLLLLLPRYFRKIKIIYKALALTAIINIIVTPLSMLLFNNLGLPILSGAAMGTIIANLCCAIFVFWHIFLKDYLEINMKKSDLSWRLDYKLLLENKGYISSQVFTGLTFNLSMFLYILILSYYPSDAFNVFAVGTYIFAFFGVLAQNFTSSLIPMVSKHVGAKEYDEIRDLVKKMATVLLSFGSLVALLVMSSHSIFASLLAAEPHLVPLFSEFIMFYSIPWALNIVATVFIFVVAGSGDAKGSMTLTIVNMYVIVIVSMFTLPHLFENVTTGVFFTLGFIQVLTFFFSWFYYLLGRWEKASLVRNEEQQPAEA
ncbi:MATE family efflux transporter [Bacillus horti]|uniref:Na+-driven multidrug efflux pump n=1 Tax=Caldalkalibacillus horti TaxID=77523 RepID=A0ABT9W1W3_9BACI|nr:MATE family efflux transporter [Bacillus horti]MDQ0167223.1 Na+-driven multidrug efflux pump [Bacillus horti]